VYEIYKVGADPHWVNGLDLLGGYGLNLAVVPHWNNTEGSEHDTRYCYIGAARFNMLERQLLPGTVILGIDEYTACVIDLAQQHCKIMGAGGITVRYQGSQWNYPAGTTFGFERLRAASLAGSRSDTQLRMSDEAQSAPASEGTYADGGPYLVQLAHTLAETRETAVQRELIDHAHDTMHELTAQQVDAAPDQPSADITPFVEMLIELRGKLRAAKQYALADEVRDKLAQRGIQLEDTSSGTEWKKVEP
jgi:hypothetical protein